MVAEHLSVDVVVLPCLELCGPANAIGVLVLFQIEPYQSMLKSNLFCVPRFFRYFLQPSYSG